MIRDRPLQARRREAGTTREIAEIAADSWRLLLRSSVVLESLGTVVALP